MNEFLLSLMSTFLPSHPFIILTLIWSDPSTMSLFGDIDDLVLSEQKIKSLLHKQIKTLSIIIKFL